MKSNRNHRKQAYKLRRQHKLLNTHPSDRRGVLLLVVLSILILFLLIGTTFILTAGQHRERAKILEKANRTTFQPEDVLERALMQLVRDTNNRHSALRYHSLLRDVYGGDGFVAQVFIDNTNFLPRYAQVQSTDLNAAGVTLGQLVDIYVVDDSSGGIFDSRNAVGLDLDSQGLPQEYSLSSNEAYYNGCLLTLMEGPCRGVSVRIVDYDIVDPAAGVARLRVMAPSRLDGQALSENLGIQPDGSSDPLWNHALTDFYDNAGGYRFIVNGRPHNGTGVGYNAFAGSGDAKLSALEAILAPDNSYYGIELALAPNSTYFDTAGMQYLRASGGTNPFAGGLTVAEFGDLLDGNNNSLYPNFAGPGDTDESYDAPDYQNMFLAHQALTPRFRGQLLNPNTGFYEDPAVVDTGITPTEISLQNVTIPSLHRPALVNFWFHRLINSAWLQNEVGNDPELLYRAVLDPYGQLGETSPVAAQIAAIKRKYSMRPLTNDHPNFDGSNPYSRNNLALQYGAPINLTDGIITAPSWEIIGPWDVDNDGDGVPDSVWVDLGLPVQKTEDGRFYKPLVAMLVEDLDNRLNLNAHGSLDHFANTNLDASTVGNLAQDYNDTSIALFSSDQLPTGLGYGPADITLRSILSPRMPLYDNQNGRQLSGIPLYDDYARLLVGRPSPVSGIFADAVDLSIDFGRYGSFSASSNEATDLSAFQPGRTASQNDGTLLAAGREAKLNYEFPGYPVLAGELFSESGYGERPDLKARYASALTATGTQLYESKTDFLFNPGTLLLDDSPYELDLSLSGRRGTPADMQLVVDASLNTEPYNEDAPYSTAELERILRATDSDAGELPNRLWDVVDAFDPEKLAIQLGNTGLGPNHDVSFPDNFPFPLFDNLNSDGYVPSSLERVVAQASAAVTRRQVTTDSYSMPVPNDNWYNRLLLGADGLPGLPNNNNDEISFDPNSGYTYTPNDPDPTNDCDDYFVVIGSLPPSGAGISDYLRYRVTLELLKQGVTPDDTIINNIIHGSDELDATNARAARFTQGGMLAPEVLAGRKMNINRPFGDGRDNNGNGTVDEPEEAGEPYTYTISGGSVQVVDFLDLNGNGVLDQDIDGNNILYIDSNGDGLPDTFDPGDLASVDFDLDGVFEFESLVDHSWIDVNGNGLRDAGELRPFEHTFGKDVSGRGVSAGVNLVNDDARLARQLYARHLYCMMLAVMDENYLAPYDENDPQVLHYLDPFSRDSMAFRIRKSLQSNPPVGYPWPGYFPIPTAGTPQEIRAAHGINARRIAMRKLTCRQVAQWAINCVDMRDPDSIQTPFEYDENPWDGWNVVDQVNGVYYSLDGDIATDENYGMYRDFSDEDGDNDRYEVIPDSSTAISNNSIPASMHTRGVVWGAERPELLLTEGLALHDRRLEDLDLDPDTGGGGPGDDNSNGDDDGEVENTSGDTPDDDLDQRLRPAGRTYVEIYNPWTDGALLAAELYRDPGNLFRQYDNGLSSPGIPGTIDTDDPIAEGLLLDRLSDNVAASGLRSPVWRLACTETHPLVRNATIPDQSSVELNDDPYTSKTSGGSGNGGEYLQLTIENGPWEYETNQFSPRIQDEADDNSPRNEVGNDIGRNLHVFAGNETLPKLPKAYINYYQNFYDNTEGLIGLQLGPSSENSQELAPRLTDPDFPAFDRLAQPVDRGSTNVSISNPGLGNSGSGNAGSLVRRVLSKPNDYLERLFYFTGAPSTRNVPAIGDVRNIVSGTGLHIPTLFYEVTLEDPWEDAIKFKTGIDDVSGNETFLDLANEGLELDSINAEEFLNGEIGEEPRPSLKVYISRFPALDYFDSDGDHPTDKHETNNPLEPVPLAPLLPGRFAVVGTAGEIFGKDTEQSNNTSHPLGSGDRYSTLTNRSFDSLEDRYTTIISRSVDSTEPASNPSDMEFLIPVDGIADQQVGFRRIEMIPSTNPYRMQFIFRMNGGFTTGSRETEIIDHDLDPDTVPVNVTDPVQFATVEPPNDTSKEITPAIQPIVAIPIEDFTISEPLDGYLIRQLELDPDLNQFYFKDPSISNTSEKPAEGGYATSDDSRSLAGYDEPFDLMPELIENQTTPNYRTMHIQRLANPRLAWNPYPISASGQIDPQHNPTRPVNPYLTIDSISLDITSLNSTSQKENVLPNTPANSSVNGPEIRHQVRRDPLPQDGTRPFTRITLQSQERGLHGVIPITGEPLPSRTLWSQDRTTGSVEVFDRDRKGVSLTQRQKIVGGNNAVRTDYSFGTDEIYAQTSYREAVLDYPLRHSLGFANRAFGRFYNYETDVSNTKADDVDLDGDGDASEYDLIGAPEVVSNSSSEGTTTPTFHWPNRPFISEGEIIQVPIWSSSRMLSYYSVYNAALNTQPNQYDGEALFGRVRDTADADNDGNLEEFIPQAINNNNFANADEIFTNRERWNRTHTTFGHLPNFFMTSSRPCRLHYYVEAEDIKEVDATGQPILNEPRVVCQGAPHFYRILDYLHVPSRFIGTDTLLDPSQFATATTDANDPRRQLAAPFNRVDNYREPGKVNLNTVVGHDDGRETSYDRWSEVYDGIMHRYQDENLINYNNGTLIQMGHLGPAWRDIEKSRRGYTNVTADRLPENPSYLNPLFPTLFANPFRAAGESLNVPIFEMRQEEVVASMLRPHHWSPGPKVDENNLGSSWGFRSGSAINSPFNDAFGDTPLAMDTNGNGNVEFIDKNGDNIADNNGIRSDASEAGTGDDFFLSRNSVPHAVPNATTDGDNDLGPRLPLMSGASLEPSLDTERNSHLRYQPITRLSNLTTTRSGVFAVWITVGFFEVTPASDNVNIAARYFDGGDPDNGFQNTELEELFFRIYPDGYTLGREIGLDTSENQRHRGFYIVDRTRPVAFKPGEDLNVEDAILLRRRIE